MKRISLVILALAAIALSSHATTTNVTGVRYWRGSGTDPKYHAFVIAIDGQSGTPFTEIGGVATNLFPQWNPTTVYFYNATNPASRIPYKNSIAGFGSRVGGSPLYTGQKYRWGLYAGKNLFTDPGDLDVAIDAYWKTNITNYAGSIDFYVPNVNTEGAAWRTFATNNFRIVSTNFGIRATLELVTYSAWGVTDPEGCYVLEIEGLSNSATNFVFDVLSIGYAVDGGGDPWLTTVTTNATGTWSDLFTIELESRPPLLSRFIDQPHFDGTPLPPEYAGKSLEELSNFTAVITNQIWLTNNAAYTTLDNAPELRRHPTLDQFVSDMRNDPLALTAYVLNEIELTDPLGFGQSGEVPADSVNPAGVGRNALGTFLERQGSPTEQCALLVYLLRQAGYPAAYVFPTNSNIKLLDARLSKLLRLQIKNAVDKEGDLYVSNRLITVNYPWVVANVSGKCIHIFPWLKDTEIKEGLEFWEYMPTNINTAYKWVREYIFGNTNITILGDTPNESFPAWVTSQLRANFPGVSIDDLGVKCFDRRKDYCSWDELPKPNVFTNQNQVVAVQNIDAVTNALPSHTLQFDTLKVEGKRHSEHLLTVVR